MELEVAQVVSKVTVHDFVLDYCDRMEWAPGKMDDSLYWAVGQGAGIYVGTLNEQPITGVAIFQHNESYAFIGLYFCEEQHRGKSYGLKTWRVARASLNPDINLVLDAVPSAASLYEREGFKRAWTSSFYALSTKTIVQEYSKHPAILLRKREVCTVPANTVDFQKLKSYVENVIGIAFARSDFLNLWITLPSHTALAALNESQDVVGFGVIRETITLDKNGYRLGPLLADSGDIARILLYTLAKDVCPKQKFIIAAPAEINPEANRIVTELNTDCVEEGVNIRMYTKADPPIIAAKYFSVFSGNIVG